MQVSLRGNYLKSLPDVLGCSENSLPVFPAAIQAELLKVKQKMKAEKDKEKAVYAKMFA